jgi:hypothetical protein
VSRTPALDTETRSYATVRELEFIEAMDKHGTMEAAADALGVCKSAISNAFSRLRARAAFKGTFPKREVRRDPDDGKRILVLPDVQAKPGIDFTYLARIGQYALEKRPDIIVCIGDFADLPSLSSYDKGKKSFEGRRYKRDVEASHWAMSAFLTPITDYNTTAKRPYKPRMVLTLGNHEARIDRAINDDSKLDGVLSIDDLKYRDFGWEVVPFLEVIIIEGVAFSHYFTTGLMGRPVTTAQACLTKKHISCIQGHQQGLQIATGYRADGQLLTSIIAGSCYQHDEEYLNPQGNKHWRGFVMLNDVRDGVFDLMPVSLRYINKRYPNVTVPTPVYTVPTAQEIEAGRV